MLQSVLDSMSEGLIVADGKGKFLIWNPAADKLLGPAANVAMPDWSHHYGLFLPDAITPFPTNQLPLVRALHGEASSTLMVVNSPDLSMAFFWRPTQAH